MENNIISNLVHRDYEENAAAIINRESSESALCKALTALPDFPEYVPEEQNPNVLIKGRWLERGGSGWFVSTAGTGKSIHSLQLSLSLIAGVPFSGLIPNIVNQPDGSQPKPLRIWICQTEDSPTRVTIDREDIIAELTDQRPDTDWRAVARMVSFVDLGGKTGVDAIDALDGLLTAARTTDVMPDILILNPFMAFVGGPVSDSNYVTPFLRGGEINYKRTIGLQGLITKHQIGLIVYHHTPKPPQPKEIQAWMEDGFAEYKGAGSSDITNWGRSFITMFKHPKNRKHLVLVAGKNGSELGWQDICGAKQTCIAWAGKESAVVAGALRHAWRELTEAEWAEFSHDAEAIMEAKVTECFNRAIEMMRGGRAFYADDFERSMTREFGKKETRMAWKMLNTQEKATALRYQIVRIHVGAKRAVRYYVGYADGIAVAKMQCQQQAKIDEINAAAEKDKQDMDNLMDIINNGNKSTF